MPRLVIFDKLPEGSHSYYDDAETGERVDVHPGDQVPAARMVDPEHYVRIGVARIQGTEDGSDGRLDRLMTLLRGAFAKVSPLDGPQKSWTLDAMVERVEDLELEDENALAAFEKAEADRVRSESDAATSRGDKED